MDFLRRDGANVADRWQKWRQTMNLYIKLAKSEKSEKDKCGAFLYIIGQIGCDIYNIMTSTEDKVDKLSIY